MQGCRQAALPRQGFAVLAGLPGGVGNQLHSPLFKVGGQSRIHLHAAVGALADHQYLGVRRQGFGHVVQLQEMALPAPPVAFDLSRPDQEVIFKSLPINHDGPEIITVIVHKGSYLRPAGPIQGENWGGVNQYSS